MIRPAEPTGMNNRRIDFLIRQNAENIDGEIGAWRFEISDILMFCITDELHDRMRVITPIANVDDIPTDVLKECLSANFDRALDARYCIHDDTIWGAFIHPLRLLTDELFLSALRQVSEVNKTFGSSYSSGELVFGIQ